MYEIENNFLLLGIKIRREKKKKKKLRTKIKIVQKILRQKWYISNDKHSCLNNILQNLLGRNIKHKHKFQRSKSTNTIHTGKFKC